MIDEVTTAGDRTKLLKGYRWPKDRFGEEIDVGDHLLYINYSYNANIHYGRVTKIGKTGKVHTTNFPLKDGDAVVETIIKDNSVAIKLSPGMQGQMMLDKLSRT